jgi:hypothetical protein
LLNGIDVREKDRVVDADRPAFGDIRQVWVDSVE